MVLDGFLGFCLRQVERAKVNWNCGKNCDRTCGGFQSRWLNSTCARAGGRVVCRVCAGRFLCIPRYQNQSRTYARHDREGNYRTTPSLETKEHFTRTRDYMESWIEVVKMEECGMYESHITSYKPPPVIYDSEPNDPASFGTFQGRDVSCLVLCNVWTVVAGVSNQRILVKGGRWRCYGMGFGGLRGGSLGWGLRFGKERAQSENVHKLRR